MRKELTKVIAGTISVLMLSNISYVSVYANDNKADLNGNNIVSMADAVILQKYLVGKLSYNEISGKGDINSDGRVNIFDMSILKKMILTTLQDENIKDYGTPMNENATTVADFRNGATPLFFASNGWTNGNPFDCGWTSKNAIVDNGYLSLSIDNDTSGKYNYTGGEYRTTDFYHYGYYETSMQAIKNNGVVSSFFTYTGPSDNNPWDEIDIEILGKDTTKVQFNYFTNGIGNHEYMYDLGFDASEGFHTYGFDWQKDSITWYVDGKEVYKATSNIPSTPGKIMMNTWPGTGVDNWLKPYDGKTPLTARYQWVTYDDNKT